ncbi:cellulose binding domain-containing protein [Hamadaea tsunoensis]|uniref:cellulose binding domain-containing protein n=1 Tax=Hamadaea tsunoensis TaxID=53368 RepID=UPI0003FC6AB4|nr:cellulose binding domain-containing protein [Hamadaea tsunoensis]
MRRGISATIACAAAVLAATGAGVLAEVPSYAAAGCSVTYTVTNQWPGGFGASVTVKNLGDALNGWTLVWSFGAGQTVTQYWSTALTQSGSQVTAKNVDYNGSLATNASTQFGFNGAWSASNPVPTAFTLNGVACTGGVTTSPSATRSASPSASASRSASPSASPSRSASASPSTSTGTPGVPSDAVWSASGQWDTWTNGGYTLYNDVWGGGAGSQTIWARTGTNWGVVANHPMTSGVKSYPHTVKGSIGRTVSSLSTLTSSFNVSVPSSGNYETAYDIWANSNAYEVMLWMNWNGAVGPIADSYDSNGAVPAFRNVTLGGHTWNIYRGSNGSNAVYSFLRTSDTNSGTVDVLAIANWLKTQGWWGDVTMGEAQFGFEISGTNGTSAFTDNSFGISWS